MILATEGANATFGLSFTLRNFTYITSKSSYIVKNNYLALIGFGIVLIAMTAATGSYLYAVLADVFFLAAYLSYRRQKRVMDGEKTH